MNLVTWLWALFHLCGNIYIKAQSTSKYFEFITLKSLHYYPASNCTVLCTENNILDQGRLCLQTTGKPNHIYQKKLLKISVSKFNLTTCRQGKLSPSGFWPKSFRANMGRGANICFSGLLPNAAGKSNLEVPESLYCKSVHCTELCSITLYTLRSNFLSCTSGHKLHCWRAGTMQRSKLDMTAQCAHPNIS